MFPSSFEALKKLAQRGHRIGAVIDVGASNAQWSHWTSHIFQSAQFLLIEVNTHHEPALRQYVADKPNFQFVIAAASDHNGTAFFARSDDPFGGAVSNAAADQLIPIPCVTIDSQVQSRNLPPPYLIKLDTHGLEVAILDGAKETLAKTDIVVLETYMFRINKDALMFDEMCRHMDNLGFRCIDMFEPLWRQHDGALWQIDMAFVRKDAPEFRYQGY